jgi:hypothetical protein
LLKTAITDLRKKSPEGENSPLFTRSGIIKIILAEAQRRKGKIIMFVFFSAPLREKLFLSVRALIAELSR